MLRFIKPRQKIKLDCFNMENVKSEEVKKLINSGKNVLVDFWAPWCVPCGMLIPRLESMESEYPNVVFVKVNVDEEPDLALDLNIRSVPTVLFYKGNELVNRISGANPPNVYKNILDTL